MHTQFIAAEADDKPGSADKTEESDEADDLVSDQGLTNLLTRSMLHSVCCLAGVFHIIHFLQRKC